MADKSPDSCTAVSDVATTVIFSQDHLSKFSSSKFDILESVTPTGKFSEHADEMAARHLSMLSLQEGQFGSHFGNGQSTPCRGGVLSNLQQNNNSVMEMMRIRQLQELQSSYLSNLAALNRTNSNIFWPNASPQLSYHMRVGGCENVALENRSNFPPFCANNNENVYDRPMSSPFPSTIGTSRRLSSFRSCPSPVKNFPLCMHTTLNDSIENHNGSSAPQEVFARKVFVGGLPMDISEETIRNAFNKFGSCLVDWPHKSENKSYCPPKGYAFLIFENESSVQSLIQACIREENKYYLCVSSPAVKDKPVIVQVRPWRLSDADFVVDHSLALDPRKTIFVGGVPRPLKAFELAMSIDRLYGGVCYAGIDTDPELKYPKGAGRVAFSNQQSYIAAIAGRFVQLQHADIDKRAEIKPYVLDDQMCDECNGGMCNGKYAPFFCSNLGCLQYYCELCWGKIHSKTGREHHKPLVKENSERSRSMPHHKWL